jgi:hypothetical protein
LALPAPAGAGFTREKYRSRALLARGCSVLPDGGVVSARAGAQQQTGQKEAGRKKKCDLLNDQHGK